MLLLRVSGGVSGVCVRARVLLKPTAEGHRQRACSPFIQKACLQLSQLPSSSPLRQKKESRRSAKRAELPGISTNGGCHGGHSQGVCFIFHFEKSKEEGLQCMKRDKENVKLLLLFSCPVVSDSATPRTAAHQASLPLTISQSLPKFTSIALVMPSSCLIL